jgi:hypothetical protein
MLDNPAIPGMAVAKPNHRPTGVTNVVTGFRSTLCLARRPWSERDAETQAVAATTFLEPVAKGGPAGSLCARPTATATDAIGA